MAGRQWHLCVGLGCHVYHRPVDCPHSLGGGGICIR